MFILYALVVGLVLGILLGGRPTGLGRLEFRWAGLIILGMAIQVALFAQPIAARVGSLGPFVYMGSTGLVLAAVIRNARLPGVPVIVLGAAANLLAIVTNGGYMPAAASALAAQGRLAPTVYSNSASIAAPALAPLIDLFAMPSWMPFANVFSIGDVLIGVGLAITIVAAMRVPASDRSTDQAVTRLEQTSPSVGGASRN